MLSSNRLGFVMSKQSTGNYVINTWKDCHLIMETLALGEST